MTDPVQQPMPPAATPSAMPSPRQDTMARRTLMASLLLLGAMTVLFVSIIHSCADDYLQARNMATARSWIPKVTAAMGGESRWQRVTLSPYTGMDGALAFYGRVEHAADLAELQYRVGELHVPVPIYWQVSVDDQPR